MKYLVVSFFLVLGTLMINLPASHGCEGNCDPANCEHDKAEIKGHSGHMAQAAEGEVAVLDPICGMKIGKGHAVDEAVYQGTTYYFCMAGEKEVFLQDPEKYLNRD